jgi:hypothetical protein
LNWEEDEEVAFCCDLRSAIYYFLSIIRVSSRLFAVRKFFIRFGAAGRIALPGEEVPRKMRGTAGGTPALPFEEAASSLSLITNHQ